MKSTLVVVRGAGPQDADQGSSRLVDHLRRALAPHHVVRSPAMPAPERPSYGAWKAALDRELDAIDGPLLLAGHSLGGSVLLKYLVEERPARPIHALCLIAAPYWGSTGWESDEFALRAGYADAIPSSLEVRLYHSRDDDVVPVAHAERYRAEIRQATLCLVDGRGHEFGDGLPELVADLAAVCQHSAGMSPPPPPPTPTLHVPSIAAPRYETGPAMLLAGVRRHHTFADAARTIPAQWQDFQRLGRLPGQRGDVAYGVVCGSDPEAGTFEYLCAAEVDALDALAPTVGRMRVPAQRYAVFTHLGGVSALRETWAAIWQEWLPRSGEQPANTPDFERYDPRRFDAARGTGEIEIWFPVAEPGQERWSRGAPRASDIHDP